MKQKFKQIDEDELNCLVDSSERDNSQLHAVIENQLRAVIDHATADAFQVFLQCRISYSGIFLVWQLINLANDKKF